MMKAFLGFLLRFFWLFGVKNNRVFFESYDGSQYSCSPKELFERIRLDSSVESVWYLKKSVNLADCPQHFIRIKRKGFLYYYYLLTSKVLITNVNFSTFIPFRRQQVLINTWHGGGAYKYAIYKKSADEIRKAYEKFSYFLSSSRIFTQRVIKDTFRFDGVVLDYGLPRNDSLFVDNRPARKKICNYFSIENDSFVVLYAPTYRDAGMNNDYERIDFKKLKDSFESVFKKRVVILCRSHHFANNTLVNRNDTINVSDYSNMQELLACSDALITDYSSCMWDFSLTYKPCFIFAPDYQMYLNKRSFYTDIYEWGFPVAFSNAELLKNIRDYDKTTFKKRVKEMHDLFGSFETGTACENTVALIMRLLNETAKP